MTSYGKWRRIQVIFHFACDGFFSSEMSELIGMSDRIMVMCDGRVTGFVDGKDATQEAIMALATQFE